MALTTTGQAPTPASSGPEPWQATRAQTSIATQIAGDENDYLAATSDAGNIGRQVGGDQHELFVSCDPAEAMQQQFDHLRPEFIALHDIGTTSSRKLLAGVAAASQRTLQKLVIRRQGYGTPLATLEFVDLPAGDGRSLRLYTTEADADTHDAPRHRPRAAGLQPARRGDGRRPAAAPAELVARAAARGHDHGPVAQPPPAAAAAGRRRPRWRSAGHGAGPRHRRARAHHAAGHAAGRRLVVHQRHLEPLREQIGSRRRPAAAVPGADRRWRPATPRARRSPP